MQYYDKKAVGIRIRQARTKNKMTQNKLAGYLDYTSERQLQRIESGETGCSIDKLMEIAQILNTSTDYLLFGMDVNSNIYWENIIRHKTDKQKLFIYNIVEAISDNLDLVSE